eukprot:337629-Rhodomonas_salina.1
MTHSNGTPYIPKLVACLCVGYRLQLPVLKQNLEKALQRKKGYVAKLASNDSSTLIIARRRGSHQYHHHTRPHHHAVQRGRAAERLARPPAPAPPRLPRCTCPRSCGRSSRTRCGAASSRSLPLPSAHSAQPAAAP